MNRTNKKGMASRARRAEEGMALILTTILVAVLATMAVSFIFLSQSETWSSMNYRLMSQARDAAEGGINKAANYLINTYVPPATGGADPIAAYTLTTSPVRVTANGNDVVLSASSVSSNYPVVATQTGYNTAAQGSLTTTVGNIQTIVNYTSSAKLLSMRQVIPYGSVNPTTIQSWLITANGTIAGIQNAQVEVDSVLERPVAPTFAYAAYGDSPNCGSLNWHGTNSTTGSYDSTNIAAGTQTYGGNVGSNGNLTEAGGATINGSLSTPRSGVGNCSSGNVTACTPSPCNVSAGITELSQPITHFPPDPPTPTPPTTNNGLTNNASCTPPPPPNSNNGFVGCSIVVSGSEYRLAATCVSANGQCAAGTTYGNISVGANKVLHLGFAGVTSTYSINSLSLGGNATVQIDGPVILNVAGAGFNPNQSPVDLGGGVISNASLNPMNFQILYAGAAQVTLKGGAQASAVVNAPLASVMFTGGGAFYGSVIGLTVENGGGADIYYDRNLATTAYTIGNYLLSAFTWKNF